MSALNVVIVLARCSRSKQLFGIRFEEKGRNQWLADWAFPIKEVMARREGYDRGEIRGTFQIAPTFPGCRSCGAVGFFSCGCGKVGCWDGESGMATCPWCGSSGELSGEITELKADADR